MQPEAPQPIRVLLIDDDEIDVQSVRRAFKRSGAPHELHVAGNGREGLERLRGAEPASALPRPYLILLDLNMPLMNGLEFLRELRGDERLRDSVVFVLTTSEAESDKTAAYQKNVAGYVVKSSAGTELGFVTDLLDRYWNVVKLPGASATAAEGANGGGE